MLTGESNFDNLMIEGIEQHFPWEGAMAKRRMGRLFVILIGVPGVFVIVSLLLFFNERNENFVDKCPSGSEEVIFQDVVSKVEDVGVKVKLMIDGEEVEKVFVELIELGASMAEIPASKLDKGEAVCVESVKELSAFRVVGRIKEK